MMTAAILTGGAGPAQWTPETLIWVVEHKDEFKAILKEWAAADGERKALIAETYRKDGEASKALVDAQTEAARLTNEAAKALEDALAEAKTMHADAVVAAAKIIADAKLDAEATILAPARDEATKLRAEANADRDFAAGVLAKAEAAEADVRARQVANGKYAEDLENQRASLVKEQEAAAVLADRLQRRLEAVSAAAQIE